jgi:hypothetical protein
MAVSARQRSWLLALADPAGPRASLPSSPLRPADLPILFDLADRHGVLPALIANLKQAMAAGNPQRVLKGPEESAAGMTANSGKANPSCHSERSEESRRATGTGLAVHRDSSPPPAGAQNDKVPKASGNGLTPSAAALLAPADKQLAQRTGLTMLLRRQAAEILAAMARTGAAVLVLKGPEFADRLYPRPTLRTFSDIDLLIPDSSSAAADRVMRDLGYQPQEAAMKYDSGYGEQAWRRAGQPGGTVEIHWNLVNSPSLRRAVSVKYEDLQVEDGIAPATRRPTAAAILLIAGVHGAASHGFDRLQILCDVAQSVRGAAGPIDEPWLAEAAGRTGAALALATALRLAEDVLEEPRCGELRLRLRLPEPPWLSKLALTRAVVLRAHAPMDSLRRQAFREMLKRR